MDKKIKIIGVPMDFGQLHRGVDMGPAALRYTGLVSELRKLGYIVEDSGDVRVPVRDRGEETESKVKTDKNSANYLEAITNVCTQVYDVGKQAVQEGSFPLFLGGDHSIAIGTIGGVSHDNQIGVIWIDAHGDFNTYETSPSGNVHGMPLAALTGDGSQALLDIGRTGMKVDPENVVLLGIRDLDLKEKERLKRSGVTVYTMRDIDEQGISTIINKALMKFMHIKRIHVSLDMDAIDPVEAPGVGTPVPGGLTYREAHLCMEIIADSGKLSSMDLVEINPILDQANKTAKLAVNLTVSALGKSIY
ncbi:MAG: arginase [Desulfamplus sp.]|nr:arginase [Desulfamplus sp.]